MSNCSTVVILASGFEETEAVAVIDVLRRAEVAVTVASLHAELRVEGAHGLTIEADAPLASLTPDSFTCVVLPGGMPGSRHLAESAQVRSFLNDAYAAGGWVAAICAAPIALHAAGLLDGRQATCYPDFADRLTGARYTGRRVEEDARVITSQGPGTALEFALYLVKTLVGPGTSDRLSKAMICAAPTS